MSAKSRFGRGRPGPSAAPPPGRRHAPRKSSLASMSVAIRTVGVTMQCGVRGEERQTRLGKVFIHAANGSRCDAVPPRECSVTASVADQDVEAPRAPMKGVSDARPELACIEERNAVVLDREQEFGESSAEPSWYEPRVRSYGVMANARPLTVVLDEPFHQHGRDAIRTYEQLVHRMRQVQLRNRFVFPIRLRPGLDHAKRVHPAELGRHQETTKQKELDYRHGWSFLQWTAPSVRRRAAVRRQADFFSALRAEYSTSTESQGKSSRPAARISRSNRTDRSGCRALGPHVRRRRKSVTNENVRRAAIGGSHSSSNPDECRVIRERGVSRDSIGQTVRQLDLWRRVPVRLAPWHPRFRDLAPLVREARQGTNRVLEHAAHRSRQRGEWLIVVIVLPPGHRKERPRFGLDLDFGHLKLGGSAAAAVGRRGERQAHDEQVKHCHLACPMLCDSAAWPSECARRDPGTGSPTALPALDVWPWFTHTLKHRQVTPGEADAPRFSVAASRSARAVDERKETEGLDSGASAVGAHSCGYRVGSGKPWILRNVSLSQYPR